MVHIQRLTRIVLGIKRGYCFYKNQHIAPWTLTITPLPYGQREVRLRE